VAQYADMCNFGAHSLTGGALTDEDIRRKLESLRRYCAELNRPYETVLRSHITMPLVLAETAASLEAKLERMGEPSQPGLFAGTPAQATTFYRRLVAAGMRYFIVVVRRHDSETSCTCSASRSYQRSGRLIRPGRLRDSHTLGGCGSSLPGAFQRFCDAAHATVW
jgi:hypothetical protein